MSDTLEGRTIQEIRPMTSGELNGEDWDRFPGHAIPLILVLDDGTLLYASRDDEGNGPGVLFGVSPNGERFVLAAVP